MSRKIVSSVMLVLLVMNMLVLAAKILPAKSSPTTIIVPDDYPTIQAAINAANAGDTIDVANGMYTEDLVIRKDSLTLIGESKDAFINGTLSINADNVTFQGFKIADDVAIVSSPEMIGDELTQPIIELSGCNNTTIIGNTVEGYWVVDSIWGDAYIGGVGCILGEGSNNVVRNNVFTSCESAIWISDESTDFVIGNDINTYSGDFEMVLIGAENTTVYHNNFYVTAYGAVEIGANATWDNGYPSGGNYWSDYNGTDLLSGQHQNVTGSDGIGDTPYVIDSSNRDNYPLMTPWMRIVGDLDGDGRVSLADLTLLAQAYKSKFGDSNWNPMADLAAPYGIISLTDLLTMAMHYGQHYP